MDPASRNALLSRTGAMEDEERLKKLEAGKAKVGGGGGGVCVWGGVCGGVGVCGCVEADGGRGEAGRGQSAGSGRGRAWLRQGARLGAPPRTKPRAEKALCAVLAARPGLLPPASGRHGDRRRPSAPGGG